MEKHKWVGAAGATIAVGMHKPHTQQLFALRAKNLRLDLAAVGAVTLLFWLATTPGSAYFIQGDTPAQDYVALAWSQGCWEHVTEKMLAVVLLTPLFVFFGPSPNWETALLAGASVVSVVTTYELSRLLTKSRCGGMFAVLFLTALPAFQFFSHTYFGYQVPCLLLAWLAVQRKQWGWAGFWFGLSFVAHFNALVPIVFSVCSLFVTHIRYLPWRSKLQLVFGGLAPLVCVEGLFFIYTGDPLIWSRGILAVISKFSGATVAGLAAVAHPNWWWLMETVVSNNGASNSAVLALGTLVPFVFRGNKTGMALGLSFLGAALFYSLQAGVGRSLMLARSLAVLYPFWVVCASAVLLCVTKLLSASQRIRELGAGAILLGLFGATVQTGLFLRDFSATLQPQVAEWFMAAAAEHRPIKYSGSTWSAMYLAQAYGVELLVGDARWIEANDPGQAVLIFEGQAPAGLVPDGYKIEALLTKPTADAMYPALTMQAGIFRRVELWRPTRPSQPIKPTSSTNLGNASYYYAGAGCYTPPRFMHGAMHFYELLWYKFVNLLKFR